MLRFVVLLHETPPGSSRPTHFDLMLECGEVLLTWSLAAIPARGTVVMGEQLPHHRLMYLDYEGPISEDRGSVRRVESGEFTWIQRTERRYEVELRGERLRGRLIVEQDAEETQRWRVVLSD